MYLLHLVHGSMTHGSSLLLEQRRQIWKCQCWPSAEEGSTAPCESEQLHTCNPSQTKWQPMGLDGHWQKTLKYVKRTRRMCKSPSPGLQSFVSISPTCTLSEVRQGGLGASVSLDKCHPSNSSLACRYLEALCAVVLLHLFLLRILFDWAVNYQIFPKKTEGEINELSRLPLQSTERDGRSLHPHVIPSAPNNLTYFSSDGVTLELLTKDALFNSFDCSRHLEGSLDLSFFQVAFPPDEKGVIVV